MSGPGGGQVPLLSEHADPDLSVSLSCLSPSLPHNLPLSLQHQAEQLAVNIQIKTTFHLFAILLNHKAFSIL